MAYNEQLADRIREQMMDVLNLREITMMGGLVFMVQKKICVGVMKEELLCRADPARFEELLEKPGCRPMALGGKSSMNGWLLIAPEYLVNNKDLHYWISLALDYSPRALAGKRKKK
jgi:TfoX/Sxy family transcriptional regulator of competence genes